MTARRLSNDNIEDRFDNPTFDQFDYFEYGGALKSGNRFLPQNPLQVLSTGAFDLSSFVSAGEVRILKSGWYSFNAKLQFNSGAGQGSITRNNSTSIAGDNTDILDAKRPLDNQEFGVHWTGYVAAGEIISFNGNQNVNNNNSITFYKLTRFLLPK